jgi:Fe2+ transport system protein FeoA
MTTLPLAVAPADPLRCALCGFEYTPGGDSCREHGCPIALGTCATRHCPNCGYTMPDEQKSPTLGFLRRLLGRREPMAAGTVAELPAGARGVVARLQGDPELLTRLTAQGLAPGVAVHLLQRSPTYVIEVGETTIALERRVAEAIVLHDPDERR